MRLLELFSEADPSLQKDVFRCWVNGVRHEHMAVRAKALFAQESLGLFSSAYVRLTFRQGETVYIVSGSIENSYMVFGFTEANLRD